MAQPILDPAPLSSFDGHSWSGLSVDKDRDSDLKKRFKTEKGAVRPEALKFVPERGGTVRVDALLDGRGGNAIMRAIRVEYKGRGPSLIDLADAWDERPVEMYQRGRTEDWHIEVFEKKGVIAVVMGNGAYPSVFVLANPDRIAVVQRQFVDGPTPVELPRDPGAGWDRLVRYSNVSLNLDVDASRPDWMNNRWMDDLRDSLRDEARNFRGDTLRSGGGSGSLNVNVTTGRFKDESTSFKVSLSLFTKTPYGDLTRFSDESRTIDYSHRARAVDLLRAALREMDSIVRAQVRNYGPEPVEAARNRAMDALYKAASGA
jgi:hypothetical protein